ncbi:MAG: Flp pilus assembly complex ATPase component TadA [Candidatus Omnitrophica bacterium]|nr:Flp pilus assembly complex ATPase component TadA [Candidatus Omnitrophota bacterium]
MCAQGKPESFRHKPIGEIFVERGLISRAQLQEALERQRDNGLPLGRVLLAAGYLTEFDIVRALGMQSNMEPIDLDSWPIPADALDKVPGSVARLYNIIPLELKNRTLFVATCDPFNFSIFDDLRFIVNVSIRGKVAAEAAISRAIKKYYPEDAETVEQIFSQISQKMPELIDDEEIKNLSAGNLEQMAAQLPIVKLINLILVQAIQRRASDIHFEPFADDFKIRFRLDGVLYDIIAPPKSLHLAISSRIKVMSSMNIAETRLPQDGRALVRIAGRMVDLRVSTLPTIFGESVVIRVLDKAAVQLSLDEVGFNEEVKQQFRSLINRTYGIILSTGPTGCGKTTTQYAALNEINRVDSKIITVEDPVEYDLPGLIQVSVKAKINFTFPLALRHILRQDPDIIMVGEIRDTETVQMAIHASLTGHLVFSTLHTNDAASAVTRLIDMGVEPFLIASSVEAVLAQRLVRRLCGQCREAFVPLPVDVEPAGFTRDQYEAKTFYRARGCPQCDNSGYRGRVGIFELLVFEEDLRSLILDRAPSSVLRQQAIKNGMLSLQDDGRRKVAAGLTSIEELHNSLTMAVH